MLTDNGRIKLKREVQLRLQALFDFKPIVLLLAVLGRES
jgi:hypothetical protein